MFCAVFSRPGNEWVIVGKDWGLAGGRRGGQPGELLGQLVQDYTMGMVGGGDLPPPPSTSSPAPSKLPLLLPPIVMKSHPHFPHQAPHPIALHPSTQSQHVASTAGSAV